MNFLQKYNFIFIMSIFETEKINILHKDNNENK